MLIVIVFVLNRFRKFEIRKGVKNLKKANRTGISSRKLASVASSQAVAGQATTKRKFFKTDLWKKL